MASIPFLCMLVLPVNVGRKSVPNLPNFFFYINSIGCEFACVLICISCEDLFVECELRPMGFYSFCYGYV